MPLSEAQKYLDHLGACSPCYRDFLELQAKYRQRRTRMIFAVAASILIVVGLASWAMLRQHNQQKMARAVLDLRDRSMARGTEPPPTEKPLEVPVNAARLEIYLPLGSSDGSYDVRIASIRGEPLLSQAGEATIEQGVTALRVDLRTPLPTRGNYVLQLRKPTAEWVSFPLHIR
jgi:hypothetical protein